MSKKSSPAPLTTPIAGDDGLVTRPWALYLTTQRDAADKPGGALPPAPPPLTAAGWSMEIVDYGATLTGQPQVLLRITVTERPVRTTLFSAWLYRGEEPPADPSGFVAVNNTPISEAGDTQMDLWLDQEADPYTLQIAVVASGIGNYEVPNESTVVKSIEIPAPEPAPALTDFDVEVVTGSPGSIPSGKYKYIFTKPSDLKYFHTRIERRWSYPDFTPQPGAEWIEVESIVDPYTQPEWWTLPAAEEYWQFRACTVTRAGIRSAWTAPVNVPVPSNTGISASLTPPPALTAAGWSMEIVDYGATLTGQPQVRLRITVTERPLNTTLFSAWLYRGAAAPADPSGFKAENNTPISASGNTYMDLWLDQESAAYTLQIAVVTSGSGGYEVPKAATVVKSIVIPAPAALAPVAGFGVSVLTGSPGNVPSGKFVYAFTKPTDLAYFHTKIQRRWSYSDFTPQPGADWVTVENIVNPYTQPTWWTLPASAEYWQYRAITVTRAGLESAPTASVNVTVPANSGVTASFTPPPALTAAGWSMEIVDYGATLTGQPQVRLRITVTERPSTATIFTAWLYRGAAAPADPSGFKAENNTPMSASGDTYLDLWLNQETAAYTLQIAVVASGSGYEAPSGSTVVKSISIPAPSPSAQPTDFTVTVETRTVAGQLEGAYFYYFPTPTDQNYWFMRIDRVWCDANFTPLHSWQIGVAELVHGNDGSAQERTWWSFPVNTEYWKFRAVPMTRAGIANEAGARTVNVTVAQNPGLISGTGANLIYNASFEKGNAGWVDINGGGGPWTFETAGRGGALGCVQNVTVASSPLNSYRQLLCSPKIQVSPGEKYVLEYWFYADPGTPGALAVYLHGFDVNNTYVPVSEFAGNKVASDSAGGWLKVSSAITIPSGVALVEVSVTIWNNYGGTGRWLVDDISFTKAPSLGAGLSIGLDGKLQQSILGDNLIHNPGWEEGLNDWTPTAVGVPGMYATNGYGVRTGKRALVCDANAAYSNGGHYSAVTGRNIPVQSHADYTYELWVWSNTTVGVVRVYLHLLNADGVFQGYTSHYAETSVVAMYNQWHKISVTANVGGAAFVQPVIFVRAFTSGGPIIFDDTKLVRTTMASEIAQVPMEKAINVSNEFTTSGGQFKMLNVDFTKATNFNTSDFEKETGSNIFKVRALSADKIRTGILEVGGGWHTTGASSRVSRFRVFDNLGQLVGWIGDDSDTTGYVGAWFKRVLIGGTSPANAQFVADSAGNVAISGNLITGGIMSGTGTTITGQNITTNLNTAYDSTVNAYVAFSTRFTNSLVRTVILPGSAYGMNANNTYAWSCVGNTIAAYDGNGMQNVVLSGVGGYVQASQGYWVGFTNIIDGSRNLFNINHLGFSGQFRIGSFSGYVNLMTPTTYHRTMDVYSTAGAYLGFLLIY